jgi:hypothetical protein
MNLNIAPQDPSSVNPATPAPNPLTQLLENASGTPTPTPQGTPNPPVSGAEPGQDDFLNQLFPDLTQSQNPMRQQIAAQQQAYAQQMAALQTQNQQYEAALFNQYLQSLPPEQQEVAKQLYSQQVALQDAQRRMAAQQAYIDQLHNQYNPIERDRALSLLSQKFGIEKSVLEQHAQTPQEAAAIIRTLVALRKAQNLEQRVEQGNDQVAVTSGQASGSPTSYDELKKKYRNSGKISQFWAEMQAAGLV